MYKRLSILIIIYILCMYKLASEDILLKIINTGLAGSSNASLIPGSTEINVLKLNKKIFRIT